MSIQARRDWDEGQAFLSMNNFAHTDQATIYLRILTRWWWIPVLFGLFSCGVTYGGTKLLMKPVYSASMELEVASPNAGFGSSSGNDANSAATLMTTGRVVSVAAKKLDALGRRDPSALSAASCSADANNLFVFCSTTSHDYRAAASALNTLGQTFLKVNGTAQRAQYEPNLRLLHQQEQQLKSDISNLRGQLTGLQSSTNPSTGNEYQITALQSQISQDNQSLTQLIGQESTLQQQIIAQSSAARIVSPAVPVRSPIGPHPARNALLGLIVGLGIAASLIVLLEYLDDTFRSSDEVAAVMGVNILGAVRRFRGPAEERGLLPYRDPRSAIAEAYRVARTNLEFASLDRDLRQVLITSAHEGEGKTTTSANLAATIALSGKRVLLVDVDLHRGGLTRLFDLRNQPGLSTAIVGHHDVSARETEVPNLWIVPSGPLPPNPAELLGSARMRDWLRQAVERYDMVILDAPPVLSVADTRVLAARVDGVVLIVDPSTSSRRLVRQMCAALNAVGARTLGTILNKGVFQADQQYYYQHYYNTYVSSDGGDRALGNADVDPIPLRASTGTK